MTILTVFGQNARQRLGVRQPSAALPAPGWRWKAAEGCRTPKPRGGPQPLPRRSRIRAERAHYQKKPRRWSYFRPV